MISQLPPSERIAVRTAFAQSLSVAWWIMFGVTCAGLLASIFMRDHKMADKVDDKWRAREDGDARPVIDSESGVSAHVHEKQAVGVGESACP